MKPSMAPAITAAWILASAASGSINTSLRTDLLTWSAIQAAEHEALHPSGAAWRRVMLDTSVPRWVGNSAISLDALVVLGNRTGNDAGSLLPLDFTALTPPPTTYTPNHSLRLSCVGAGIRTPAPSAGRVHQALTGALATPSTRSLPASEWTSQSGLLLLATTAPAQLSDHRLSEPTFRAASGTP